MNILFFSDQHPSSLGGAQNSLVMQAKFLKKAGHSVTIVCPKGNDGDTMEFNTITYRSIKLRSDSEYVGGIVSRKSIIEIKVKLREIGPYDIVHIQADYWGAVIGINIAQSLSLPIVMTCHNNVSVGLQKALGQPVSAIIILLFSYLLQKYNHSKHPFEFITVSGDKYLRNIVHFADEIILPSKHFARLLSEKIQIQRYNVLPTGIDDDLYDSIKDIRSSDDVVIWSGRFSKEKRIIPFLKSIVITDINNPVHIYGDGPLKKSVERFVRRNNMRNVFLMGKVSHRVMLERIAQAKLVVQTSIGFETQGMTVYEACAFNTPVIVCDENIYTEIQSPNVKLVKGTSVDALAEAITDNVLAKLIDNNKNYFSYLQSNLTRKQIVIYNKVIKQCLQKNQTSSGHKLESKLN